MARRPAQVWRTSMKQMSWCWWLWLWLRAHQEDWIFFVLFLLMGFLRCSSAMPKCPQDRKWQKKVGSFFSSRVDFSLQQLFVLSQRFLLFVFRKLMWTLINCECGECNNWVCNPWWWWSWFKATFEQCRWWCETQVRGVLVVPIKKSAFISSIVRANHPILMSMMMITNKIRGIHSTIE